MASATQLDNANDCELCLKKYNRSRPSFCQCKHCPLQLCCDCLKEHHDEILQYAQTLSHQYNQLQELIQTKQKMIDDETTKSIDDVNHYFDTYIDDLRQTQKNILESFQTAKLDAQNDMLKTKLDLQVIGTTIQSLTKENIVQAIKAESLSLGLKQMEEKLSTFKMIKTENLIETKPEFAMKFIFSFVEIGKHDYSERETNETGTTIEAIPLPKTDASEIQSDPDTEQRFSTEQANENDCHQNSDTNSVAPNDLDDYKCRDTFLSYNVDRIASDGENILYTSYFDGEQDLIAYYCIDAINNCSEAYRDWKQSRIQDMIWWNTIQQFVCATNDAIYVVEYINRRFRIISVIQQKWSYIRIAANNNELFVWMNSTSNIFNGFEIYSPRFEHTRTIDFDTNSTRSFVDASSSFCVTNDLIGSLCIRSQHNRRVFQVNFSDLNMNKFNTVLLGTCDDNIEIRSDGHGRFFITSARHPLHIVRSNGEKRTINLRHAATCIAVLHNRRIAVANGSQLVTIITY